MLLAALILAGCTTPPPQIDETHSEPRDIAAPEAEAVLLGRYVEQEVTPEGLRGGRVQSLQVVPAGGLLLQGQDAGGMPRAYTTTNPAEGWTEQDSATLCTYRESVDAIFFRYTYDMQGGWWAGHNDGSGLVLAHINPDGEATELPLPGFAPMGQPGAYLQDIRLVPGGLLVTVANSPGVCYALLDETGALLQTYTAPFYLAGAAAEGERLYLLPSDGNAVEVHTLADGATGEALPIAAGLSDIELSRLGTSLCLAPEGLCYLGPDGIYLAGQRSLVLGHGYAWGQPGFDLKAMAATGMEDFLLAAEVYGEARVYRVWYDPEAPIAVDGTLALWAMEDTPVLRAALYAFQKEYPGWVVEPTFGRAAGDTLTDEEIIQALNLRLLAGQAPDVLILDGLPVQGLTRNGLLADISGLVEPEGFYENILNAYRMGGAVYAYPALFKAPLLLGKGEGAESLDALAALTQGPETLFLDGWRDLFNALYTAYSPTIFPDGTGVDEEALRAFFAATLAMVRAHDAGREVSPSTTISGNNIADMVSQPVLEYYSFGAFHSGVGYTYGLGMTGSVSELMQAIMQRGATTFTLLPGGAFQPVCAAAVPTAAAEPDMAGAFITTLLQSDEVQRMGYLYHMGFSVRPSVNADLLQEYINRQIARGSWPPQDVKVDALGWDDLFLALTAPTNQETQLYRLVYEAAGELYAGQLRLDEAIDRVAQRAALLFAERA